MKLYVLFPDEINSRTTLIIQPMIKNVLDSSNNVESVVYYSLGNFISNQGILYSTIGYKGVIGAFATLNIDKTTFNGESKISLDNLEVELLYTYKNSQQRYYKIIPFSKMNNNYLNNYQSVYETYKNVIQKYDQNIVVKPCA